MDTGTTVDEQVRVQAAARPTLLHATLVFAGLTAILTWPQICHFGSIPAHEDSWFSMWRLGWIAHQLARAPLDLFSANIFYPASQTLAYSDAVLLPGIVAAPFIWLGVPIVVVYNLLILASFVLCGVGAFLLVRDLTGRADAALLSGIVFAFAPFRFDHYFHLELLWAQWMPLTLLMLHRTLQSGRLRDGLLTGLFFAAQVLSCIYYAVYFATALAVVAPILLVLSDRAVRRRAAIALAAGMVLCAALSIPYFLQYRTVQVTVGERAAGTARLYAAGPRHYIAALPQSVIYGPVTGNLGRPEKRLFPGFAVFALAAVAVLGGRRDRMRLVYAVFGLVAVDLSFGPRGVLFGWLREYLVVYRGLRVPARAAHLALLAFAVFAGYGMAYLAQRGWWRRWAVSVFGAVVVAEYLMQPIALVPVQTAPSEVYRWLRTQPQGPVVELPLPSPALIGAKNVWPWHDPEYEYLSAFHWQPLVNGYSGECDPTYYQLLEAATLFPDDGGIAALQAIGARYLVVHERFYGTAKYRTVTATLDQRRDLVAYGSFNDYGHEARVYGVRETRAANE